MCAVMILLMCMIKSVILTVRVKDFKSLADWLRKSVILTVCVKTFKVFREGLLSLERIATLPSGGLSWKSWKSLELVNRRLVNLLRL